MKTYMTALFLTGCIVFLSQKANGSIILSITDDGTDLTMKATGSYDVSSVTRTSGFAYLVPDALVASGMFGWKISDDASDTEWIEVDITGSLTVTSAADTATTTSTSTPFWFAMGVPNNRLVIPKNAPDIGLVNETAVFQGVTLASLGMVEKETMTLLWSGDSITVTTGIPEPSTLALLGGGSIIIFGYRSRIRR